MKNKNIEKYGLLFAKSENGLRGSTKKKSAPKMEIVKSAPSIMAFMILTAYEAFKLQCKTGLKGDNGYLFLSVR